MKIIGAGFGRTGTLSLQSALKKLGYDPCYHMIEAFKHPSHAKIWEAASLGEPVDWQQFLGGYQAGVDYPICNFYKELQIAFPDAKVLLSVRDPEKWYESSYETVYAASQTAPWLTKIINRFHPVLDLPNKVVWDRYFNGRFSDRDYAISFYNQHIAEVKATVPAEKLLVFDVKEGWEPLCQFLDKPIPKQPFPHLNDREKIKKSVAFLQGIDTLARRFHLVK